MKTTLAKTIRKRKECQRLPSSANIIEIKKERFTGEQRPIHPPNLNQKTSPGDPSGSPKRPPEPSQDPPKTLPFPRGPFRAPMGTSRTSGDPKVHTHKKKNRPSLNQSPKQYWLKIHIRHMNKAYIYIYIYEIYTRISGRASRGLDSLDR